MQPGEAHASRLTLVPFAGSNLIRFRGSRINGLSRCLRTRHSDKKSPVLQGAGKLNYALMLKNSSRASDVAVVVSALCQVEIKRQHDQLILQRKACGQRFANAGQRFLELQAVIVVDSILKI